MCLTTFIPKAEKSNKDIVTYKIFYPGIQRKTGKEMLCSPYTEFSFLKNKKVLKGKFRMTNHKTIWKYYGLILRYFFKKEGYKTKNKSYSLDGDFYYTIEDGFIHSYTNKEAAISRITYGGMMVELCEVYECIIPKGTYLYLGDDEADDIASRKLKIIKRVY